MSSREPFEKASRDLPDGLAVDVALTIRLHRNGSLSVEGPVADKAFCKQLLEHGWDAIKRQHSGPRLVVPSCDVDVKSREAYTS